MNFQLPIRRIAVVTGTRAEYGLLKTTIAAIDDSPRLKLQIVATGMHLIRKFGYTVRDIERDGWPIDARIRMQTGADDPLDQALGLAKGVAGIARFLQQAKSDMVLVLGDRVEAMAGALAAVTTGRTLAHIHGGDVAPGDFDDPLRNAITMLAHIHLTASKRSMRRVLRMVAPPRGANVDLFPSADRVFFVGAPGLDDISRLRGVGTAHQLRRVGTAHQFAAHHTALVVQHAYGRSVAHEARVMTAILKAVASEHLDRIIIYPNSDRGYQGVLSAIERHQNETNSTTRVSTKCVKTGSVKVLRSLPRDEYLRTLIAADVIVGNSSSGIIEAPFAGTPTVNVGTRQLGRQRGGSSVLDASENVRSIRKAIGLALKQRPRRTTSKVYGDGGTGLRIAAILAKIK